MKMNAVVVVSVFSFLMLPSATQALNRFGVVCVTNKTELIVPYRFKETDGVWHIGSLRPGWQQSFVHKYTRPNEDRSPELDIQFDSDLRAQKMFSVKYKLPRLAAPGDGCKEGAQYQFQYDRGERFFIDLKKMP
jgi:hypothetical protein